MSLSIYCVTNMCGKKCLKFNVLVCHTMLYRVIISDLHKFVLQFCVNSASCSHICVKLKLEISLEVCRLYTDTYNRDLTDLQVQSNFPWKTDDSEKNKV